MVNLYEKIFSLLKPVFNSPKKRYRSQNDYVVLYALIMVAVHLMIGLVVLGVYSLVRGSLGFDWRILILLAIIAGIGFLLVLFNQFKAARYLVVSVLLGYSLLTTFYQGFTVSGIMAAVVSMLFAFLVLDQRNIIVFLIIVLPPIVYRFFSPPETYQDVDAWMYLAMMSMVGFLIGLLNYLNERAQNSLVQIDTLQAVQQAGVSVLSSLDLQETTSSILEELQNILPHDSASVLLLRDGTQLEIVAGSGWEDPYDVIGIKFPIPGDNPNSIVIQEGRPLILTNAPEEHPPFREEPHNHILSWLGVPLITRGEIIGMMAIDSRQEGYFSEDHIRLVSAFADHVAIAIDNARLYDLATQAANRRSILYHASQEVIKAGADLEFIYRAIHNAASELMVVEAFVVSLLDETEQFIDGAYLIDRGMRDQHIRIPLGEGMSATVIQTGHSILETDLLAKPDFKGEHFGHEDEVRSLVAVPFSIGNKVIGMLSAQSYSPGSYGQDELELLQQLAAQAGVAIQNARLLKRMDYLANTDSMTGLNNRRAFDTSLAEEIHRAERYGYPLALMIMDIDDFKQFNDRYGHSRGDLHLRQIGSLIQTSVRESDIVARIGGEEFSVIMPHTSCQGAVELAERIRVNVENAFKETIKAGGTISIGVAEFPREGGNPGELFDAADRLMFQVKRSGKNRVGKPHDMEHS